MKQIKTIIIITLLLSIISLFIEEADFEPRFFIFLTNIIDFLVFGLLWFEFFGELHRAPYKSIYLRKNFFSFLFLLVYSALFLYTKSIFFYSHILPYRGYTNAVVIIRNLFLLLKVFGRIKRLTTFIESITMHPAQTLVFSFLLIILIGTLVLMMPFTTVDGKGLVFIDALFTATSAVCVTGLIVVDTATHFTLAGKLIIMSLIQVGGLGIMILSYFTIFVLRRRVSIKDKLLISYVLSENDMSNLVRTVKTIISITFLIEGAGMLLLFIGFASSGPVSAETILFSGFHAVSAFCNAGFALFTDSLEQFRDSTIINGAISALIILGGISFGVIINVGDHLREKLLRLAKKKFQRIPPLTLNTKIILIGTGVLLGSGTLLIYALEHNGVLREYPLGVQYGAAFFQSVTLRTAGFNTVPFHALTVPTYLIMIVYMFIGAASGSTAGGIKINSVAVLGGFVKTMLQNKDEVIIARHFIPFQVVLRAFLILVFGILCVFAGTFVLTLSETGVPLIHLLFESVSAFGTVGLSAGITGGLSVIGKMIIIILMFIGRLGPLTIIAAASQRMKKIKISYPEANIAIG
jgi:trk system potassium uptake protein TrkH